MSVSGSAAAKKILRGKLTSCEMIYMDAYELAVIHGFEGTIEEWLASIKGEKGDTGAQGAAGETPVYGVDYYTEADKAAFANEVEEAVFGEFDSALDRIIAIQEALIGGETA